MCIERGWPGVRELHSAGNLSVLTDTPISSSPTFLEFHYKRDNRRIVRWRALLTNWWLLLDTSIKVLVQQDQESLTAVLEFVEQKTDINLVFVSVNKEQRDRGDFLRAFSYLGFEIVRPGHLTLPPCKEQIFLAYMMDRDLPSL
ncbi:ornithine decarboxylase antizyme 3 [Discoglossus pictus]